MEEAPKAQQSATPRPSRPWPRSRRLRHLRRRRADLQQTPCPFPFFFSPLFPFLCFSLTARTTNSGDDSTPQSSVTVFPICFLVPFGHVGLLWFLVIFAIVLGIVFFFIYYIEKQMGYRNYRLMICFFKTLLSFFFLTFIYNWGQNHMHFNCLLICFIGLHVQRGNYIILLLI